MQTLNLKQLEAFVAVVESGSFTAAAERLFLAQSTISGHVAALEKDLGVALLLRTGRRQVALTEEGRRVYAHARTILQSCGELSRDLEEHKSQELSLAASSIPMQYILPRLLADFSGIMPQCRFSLRGGDSEAVQRIVLSGEVQLGFAGAVFSGRDLHQDLLAQDSLVLVAPDTEEYRDLRQAGTPGNLLLDRPLIVRENGSGTQQAADRVPGGKRVPLRGPAHRGPYPKQRGDAARRGLRPGLRPGIGPGRRLQPACNLLPPAGQGDRTAAVYDPSPGPGA